MEIILRTVQNLEKPEKMAPLFSAVAATGLAAYFTKQFLGNIKDKQNSYEYEKIPVPEGEVYYLGHLLCFQEATAPVITKWHEQYGPLINVKMGVQNWVFIGDPHWAQDIFASNGVSTSGRPHFTFTSKFMSEGGRGFIFNDHHDNWKNARRASLNILSPTAVHGFNDVICEESERCTNDLLAKTFTHGEVNPLPHIQLFAFNVMLSVVYGVEPLQSPEDPLFKKMLNIVETTLRFLSPTEDLSAFLPALSFLDVIFGKEKKMQDFWQEESLTTTKRLLEESRNSDRDSLARKIDSLKDDLELDEQNIIAILTEVFNAGIDSVSTSIVWTYIILCNYPEVQKKLINEIDDFVKTYGCLPTFDDRLELPYYNAFQKECLRFRPVNYFGIPHRVVKDVVYKNYLIPKGTILASNTHTLHFDKTFYHEPEKFSPERFLDNTKSLYATSNGNVSNRDQFVFGWGRRLCPGISIAERELFNNIIQLLSSCTIEPILSPSGETIYPDLHTVINKGTTIHPAASKMRFVRREN